MVRLGSFPFVSVLLFSTFTNAWHIDDDCQGEKREFITQALNNAFQLNNYARAGFGSLSPEKTQLLEFLFGTDAGTRERLGQKLEFISAVNRVNQPKEDLGIDDFTVHCTIDRIEKRGTNRYYDPEAGQNLNLKDKLLDCKTAVAYTIRPQPDENGNYVEAHYNIVQVCPWFLDYVMRRDPQFQNAIDKNIMIRLIEEIGEWAVHAKYTAIDMVSLFDKVLLHEISHTTGAGITDDVGGFSGYGWKNCRKLSTVVTVFNEDDEVTTAGPEQNADSIALYGSVSRMLIDGAIISEDGNFVTRGRRMKRSIADFRAFWPSLESRKR